jgi:DNA repair protein RadA/Sms
MVLAVLAQQGVPLSSADVHAATVGGVRLSEPAADLAVALALSSAVDRRPVPQDVVAIGEVALSGDIRPVSGVARRLLEARRLGFTRAFVPVDAGITTPPAGMRVTEVADLRMALVALSALRPVAPGRKA